MHPQNVHRVDRENPVRQRGHSRRYNEECGADGNRHGGSDFVPSLFLEPFLQGKFDIEEEYLERSDNRPWFSIWSDGIRSSLLPPDL